MKNINLLIVLILALLTTAVLAAEWEVTGATPTQREDSSALGLSEIAGFNMYCGVSVGNYQDKTYFAGATLPDTTWLVTDLTLGTHYCVFTTLDIDGRESQYSEYVTLINDGKALPKPPLIAPNQVFRVVTSVTQ